MKKNRSIASQFFTIKKTIYISMLIGIMEIKLILLLKKNMSLIHYQMVGTKIKTPYGLIIQKIYPIMSCIEL